MEYLLRSRSRATNAQSTTKSEETSYKEKILKTCKIIRKSEKANPRHHHRCPSVARDSHKGPILSPTQRHEVEIKPKTIEGIHMIFFFQIGWAYKLT